MSFSFLHRRSEPAALTAVVAVCVAAWLLGGAHARAAGARFALLIEGASGEEQYAVQHRTWLDGFVTLFSKDFHYDADHLVVLAEEPKAGESKATADGVKAALAKLASTMTADDQLTILLIGHGSGQGTDEKFNLVGPDLGVSDWAALAAPIRGRLIMVDTTSASFPFLPGFSGPDRVIVTATNSAAQRYHTVFPDALLKAFHSADADLDKNGRISVLEAFTYASRLVKQSYEQQGTMATEVAALDDNGDGKGRDASATGPDGAIAAVTYFDTPVVRTSADPETQRLLDRQRALNEQIDDLKRRQTTMNADDFNHQIEALVTELAEVSIQIRQREAKR
jgi:hypothetical protein